MGDLPGALFPVRFFPKRYAPEKSHRRTVRFFYPNGVIGQAVAQIFLLRRRRKHIP
ncbi:MAG: hypothetical protein RL742_700, partial [Bacteroidota bacterium]